MTVYARVSLGTYLIPVDQLGLLANWVRMDYDWDAENKKALWKLAEHTQLSFEFVKEEELTAMRVAEKLEG